MQLSKVSSDKPGQTLQPSELPRELVPYPTPHSSSCLTVDRSLRDAENIVLSSLRSSNSELSTRDCLVRCFHFETRLALNILLQFNLDWVDMPNRLGVFPNRSVGGKFPHSSRVKNGHSYPVFPLPVSLADLVLAFYVGLVIGQ